MKELKQEIVVKSTKEEFIKMFSGFKDFQELPQETKDFYYKFFRSKSKHKDEPKDQRKA